MCCIVWIVRYVMEFMVWYDRLINTHIAKLLLLISYLLWLFVCMSVLLFIFLPACTFICVNARVSLLLLLFLSVFLCLLYVRWLSVSFTNPPPISLYFFSCFPPFVHPPPSFLPSPHPSSLSPSLEIPCDHLPNNSHSSLITLHSPSLDYPSSHPCIPSCYLPSLPTYPPSTLPICCS